MCCIISLYMYTYASRLQQLLKHNADTFNWMKIEIQCQALGSAHTCTNIYMRGALTDLANFSCILLMPLICCFSSSCSEMLSLLLVSRFWLEVWEFCLAEKSNDSPQRESCFPLKHSMLVTSSCSSWGHLGRDTPWYLSVGWCFLIIYSRLT